MQLDFKLANSSVSPKLDWVLLRVLIVVTTAGQRLYHCHTSPDSLGGRSSKLGVPACRRFCN